MTLDIEIPVLRGFLTKSEATTWKQNIVKTAGKMPVNSGYFTS